MTLALAMAKMWIWMRRHHPAAAEEGHRADNYSF